MFEFLQQMMDADNGTNPGGTNEGVPEGGTTTEEPTKDETPALTMEQIQKMIQSETDKVRTEYSKKLKEAEAAKLELERAKLTDEERKKAEQEDLMKQLQEKEQALLARELEIKAIDMLKANEIPLEFKDFVIDVSEEKLTEKTKVFKKLWQSALKTAVENKFKENGRTVETAKGDGTITKEQFNKMGYKERVQLFESNPELYKELSKN